MLYMSSSFSPRSRRFIGDTVASDDDGNDGTVANEGNGTVANEGNDDAVATNKLNKQDVVNDEPATATNALNEPGGEEEGYDEADEARDQATADVQMAEDDQAELTGVQNEDEDDEEWIEVTNRRAAEQNKRRSHFQVDPNRPQRKGCSLSVSRTTMSPMISALTNATVAAVIASVEEDTEVPVPRRTTRSQ